MAVRGTATMEDVVTDSVAQPEALHDWLPEDIHKVLSFLGIECYTVFDGK